MTDYRSILVEDRGPVRLVTLNRPKALNAINAGMNKELHDALDEAEMNPGVRVIIIAGAGRAFSSGYDISPGDDAREIDPESMLPKETSAAEYISNWFQHDRDLLRNQTHILELSKPVIAAVHGWCMGAGTWIALTCDLTLASTDAVFAQPEVRQISNTGFIWALMAGYKNALRYSLTGDHVDAQEAFRIGLVNDVLSDHESLMDEAFRLANRIALNSPETVTANKYIATLGLEMMGLRNALTTNWLLSTIAHSSQRSDYRRREMLDAAKARGMKGFLDVRDGPFQPEPFGPRSKQPD